MATTEMSDVSSVVERFAFHKDKTGCGEIAAALLALAEVINRTPPSLAIGAENGIGPSASFSTRLSGNGKSENPSRTESVRDVRSPRMAVSSGRGSEEKPLSSPSNGVGKGTAHSRVRPRGDRNHADLHVIEDFLPNEEKKRLAEFMESVGFNIGEKHNGQELLTLVVHYVTRMRKVVCSHSHIHTVLRKMGVATPADLGGRLRDVGRRLEYIDPSNGQNIQLTMKGENWIDIALPKRMAQAKVAK